MGKSDPHRRDGPNRSGHYRLWSYLILLAAHGSYAQDLRPAKLAGQSLTVAVTADIAQRCGNTISAPLIQDVASELRRANISVAKVHNAELTTAIDCAPARAHNQRHHEAVQYCVGLSQVIAVPTAPGRHTLATTWRQCGSTTCTTGTCDTLLRAEVHNLVTAVITDLHDTGNSASSGPAPRPPPATPAHEPTQAHADSIGSRNPMNLPVPLTRSTVIYFLYIITCLGVLLQWEYRKYHVH